MLNVTKQDTTIEIKEESERLFSEKERQKYLDMVQIMSEAVQKESTSAKVAILTFKVVEETIKRAYMKAHLNNLMPASALTTQKWIRYTEKVKKESQKKQRVKKVTKTIEITEQKQKVKKVSSAIEITEQKQKVKKVSSAIEIKEQTE